MSSAARSSAARLVLAWSEKIAELGTAGQMRTSPPTWLVATTDSAYFGQLHSQFVGGAEQCVLDRAFRRVQHSGNGTQPHAVVVLELEHHSLARRKPAKGPNDALLEFPSRKASFRTGSRAVIGHAVEQIFRLAVWRHRRIQVPAARILLAQVIQTEVGDDAINPSVERTLEPEARKIDVSPEKRFLINVLPIFRRTSEVDGQPQHGAIVLPHQFFESGGVALLGLANQHGIVHSDRRP